MNVRVYNCAVRILSFILALVGALLVGVLGGATVAALDGKHHDYLLGYPADAVATLLIGLAALAAAIVTVWEQRRATNHAIAAAREDIALQIEASWLQGLAAQRIEGARLACEELISLYMRMVDAISDLAANASEVRSGLASVIDEDELRSDKQLVHDAVERYKALQVAWTSVAFRIEFLGGNLIKITEVLRVLFAAKEDLSRDYIGLFVEAPSGPVPDPTKTMDRHRSLLAAGQGQLQDLCTEWIVSLEKRRPAS